MASIGHVAVGLAAARWEHARPRPLLTSLVASMVLYAGLSLLPDFDVIGFRLGVAYEDPWGHRGATHSLFFALCTGLLVALLARLAQRPFARTFALCFLVVVSHGLLDTLTDGGLGAALWWPFSNDRIFAPLTPLPVAPIGRGLLSQQGLRVMLTEFVWFAPMFVYALLPRRATRTPSQRHDH
ncbi:MAG: metal-dependent hydrolase [Myxococcales bacterium]